MGVRNDEFYTVGEWALGMATNDRVLRGFVAAPGDIGDERDIIGTVMNDWNTHRGRSIATRLKMVWWGNSARPQMGGRPQALINEQVPSIPRLQPTTINPYSDQPPALGILLHIVVLLWAAF